MTDSHQTKITVFVVEDFDLLREGLTTAIRREDDLVCVGEAADGLTALHKINESKPMVVVMDIGLPQMDGIQVTSELAKTCPATRVVMLTSHDDDNEIFAAFAAGASGYCLKDTAAGSLKLAIRSVASGAAWFDPRIASRLLDEIGTFKKSSATSPGSTGPAIELSERELEVLELVTEGLSNKEIANRLQIHTSTVRTHVEHILNKLSASGRTEAAVKAIRMGIVN